MSAVSSRHMLGGSMKQKEKNLLEFIINHPFCNANDVMKFFTFTERQFTYRLSKLNYELKKLGFKAIKRTHKGTFVINQGLMLSFEHELRPELNDSNMYQGVMLLKILAAEYTSLDDLSWLCSLSKNTILKDLKEVKDNLRNDQLQLVYTRLNGYQITGEEEKIRNIIYRTVESILMYENGIIWLNTITSMTKEELDVSYYQFTRIEKALERVFLDEQIKKMVYLLCFIQKRIEQGKKLSEPSPYENQIRGTKEFQTVIKIFSYLNTYPMVEQIYVTTIILGSKVTFLKQENQNDLLEVIEKVCQNFENICQIQLQKKDREIFKTALFQHWLPTQYHIQFNFHVENPLHEYIVEKYKYLYICTKAISEPLASLLKKQIPPQELSLLTILFGGWLKKYEILDTKIRLTAIVVCPSGISISNLVFFTLKELFPEIHFIDYCSVRQFKNLDYNFDIVFSTVSLKTEKRVFLMKPDFHEDYKQQLRRSVISALFQNESTSIQLETLMQIIEGFVQIDNKSQLEKRLHAYLYPNDGRKQKFILDAQEPSLLQLLVPSHIQFHHGDDIDWKTAIWIASQPLLKDETIEKRYIKRMLAIIEEEQPFIELGKEIMIAHASIEDGVLQPCIAMLQLDKPILICNYFRASTIFVLATTDYQIHLKALNQLFDIIKDQNKQQRLKKAAVVEDIISLVEEETVN